MSNYVLLFDNLTPRAFFSEEHHGYKLIETFDEDGVSLGFIENPHCSIPPEAIEITQEQLTELAENSSRRRLVDGVVVVFEPPAALPTQDDYEDAIQALVDSKPIERKFRDGVTMASYVASTIPQWAAEAQTFVAWRDQIWLMAYAELQKVTTGQRPQPTVEEFLLELPQIDWPALPEGSTLDGRPAN